AIALLVIDSIAGRRFDNWHLPAIASAGFVASIVFALVAWGEPELQFSGMIAADNFAVFSKVTLAVFGLLTVWLSREYLVRERIEESEFYALTMFAVAGMMLMSAASDLIVMFIALETFSLALYVMVGFRRRSLTSQESAMKYFLLGSFSSAFFLLGIALAYGAAGSTNFYSVAPGAPSLVGYINSTSPENMGLLVAATGFIIVGLGFKVAAVPFHMWTPDAYQGAPSPVTGFMAASSKLAGFAALVRVLDATLFPLRTDWRPLVIGIAVATMIVGSVVAVVQEDVKRMLAYSSIAHAGFVLTAIVATSGRGVSASLFYLATYGVTVLGGFAVVAVVSGPEERRVRLVDLKGLFFERPVLAAVFTLFMLSLAGVPLTSGFVAKLVVFGAAVDAGYTWLVVIGVLASAVAAFFYLRVLVVMYMQESDHPTPPPQGGVLAFGVVGIAAVATIVLGLYWGPLMDLAQKARLITG
ncbi:MAG: NADH-quinone oxidoreductase subunit N, partial [Actinobacteria bacterium]|nr:NADH-quinone oxidoreductase subunit N [Actinomycetota bacterium]